ncbi:glycosyltransferase [Polynucleobacter sphagniphilus]|uniref:glycosyltransferase n=1 Tax=Polynucleobacter sphagniphilus TaxID=1743169 RepID=UPI002404AFB0|nr:glycosyltransferase [Polynucleobacter sphagniphilus]MDF9787847.1 glycosyltransferase involved in cell wall biosynthesis [Polynucleobacter sphagniphilus]
MKISFITGTIDHSNISGSGGVAFVLSRIASILASRDIEVEIICAYKGDSKCPFFINNLNIQYLQNFANHEKFKNNILKKLYWIYILPFIWNFVKNCNSDYIISTSPPITALLFLPSIFFNKKVISWENISFSHYKGIFYRMRLFIFKKIHSVITVSTNDDLFFKNNGIKSNLIFNPIDKPEFFKKNIRKDFNFLCAGRLVNQKGFDLLIGIINIYELKFKDVINLTIIGDGPDKEMLLKLVNKFRLKSKINFENFNPNLRQFYLNSDVFLLPSRYEGLPIVLLESQSYGIPAIAFDCPTGPKDVVVDNFNGFLIQCFDLEEFANSMHRIKFEAGLLDNLSIGAFKKSDIFSGNSVGDVWMRIIYNDFQSY